jgi:drug/metabolite transporter (DMT)-like permease
MGVAVCTAIFSITDAQGVRAAGDPFAYGAAVAIVTALGLPLLQHFEGVHVGRMLRDNLAFGFLASFLSMGSYLLVLYAFMHAPVAPSSAIRETSVLFGTVLAALFLGETIGRLRWLAILLAVAGVATIRLS